MMPSCPYFVLSTPSSLNMWTCIWILVFAWGQTTSKLGGVDTSILHHAFMLIFIALWTVIILGGTILMPFLSYFARFIWRGRIPAAGILDWKRSKSESSILRNSKCPQNQRGIFWEYIKNSGRKKCQRGATRGPQAWLPPPTPLAAATGLVGTLVAHWPPSFAIWRVSSGKKSGWSFFVDSLPPRGGTWADPI